MKEKISVVTICKNSGDVIERTILSVVKQTVKPYEYIVIDGNSNDNSLNIISKYEENINLVISEDDRGISDALNKGIRYSSGEYILFVHAGDCLNRECISQLQAHIDGEYDIYRCYQEIKDTSSGKTRNRYPTLRYPGIPFVFHCCHMGAVIKKEAYEKFGDYSDEFRIAMDKELLFRFHRLGAKEKDIDVKVGTFFSGGISNTPTRNKYLEEIRIQDENSTNMFEKIIYRVYLTVRYAIKRIITAGA